jgi:hypothetical protein
MPPGFLNGAAKAEWAVYRTVYYKEYDEVGVRFGANLIPRYIVQEISRVQILVAGPRSPARIGSGRCLLLHAGSKRVGCRSGSFSLNPTFPPLVTWAA